MEKLNRLNFHLFDGEGASDGGGGGLGPEASAFLESIGEPSANKRKESSAEPKADLSNVQYGRAKSGEERTSGQVGSDQQAMSIEDEFAELIARNGRYHDIYGQKVSEAIQQRFKNQANLQAQVDGISNALSPLFANYGLKAGDLEGLKNALEHDEDFYRSGAEKAGLDIETYKENLKLKAEAERGRQITEAYERQQRQNEMFARWEQETAELKQAFPGFDLALELQNNEKFARLLDSGMDVATAFTSTHLSEILQGQQQDAVRSSTQNVVNTIQARASRPMENGLRHTAAIERRSDPSTLTNDDMDEIMRRVENGESFSF